MEKLKEVPDSERTVLQILFEDGSKLFCNNGSYMAVSDPYYATRYPPIDGIEARQKSQDEDKRWMEGSFEAEISYVNFLQAVEDYKKIKAQYED